jgi:hypothetical protein
MVGHHLTSLYYRLLFWIAHRREPCWADSIAHCPSRVKALYAKQFRERGIDPTTADPGKTKP